MQKYRISFYRHNLCQMSWGATWNTFNDTDGNLQSQNLRLRTIVRNECMNSFIKPIFASKVVTF